MKSSVFRLRAAVALIVMIIAAFLFVYPTQSLLAQQRAFNAKRREVAAVLAENQRLAAETRRLTLPSEIERVARQRFNMVRKNEQAFSVVEKTPKKVAATKP